MQRAIILLAALTLIGVAVWTAWVAHENRFDRLAKYDLRKFQESASSDLYVSYPNLIVLVADDASLANRVTKLHLSGSDFSSGEFDVQDFSAIARLPNLVEIECTYARRADLIVPLINSSRSLETLNLYYCGPADALITACNSTSLRHLRIHSYTHIEIPESVLEDFANRMPECKIHFSTD